MSSRSQIFLNFTAFQLGWFACVITAEQQRPVVGIVIALVIVAANIILSNDRIRYVTSIISVTLIGTIWDSMLTFSNILVYEAGMVADFLAPSWIIAMWLLFATTLNVSLRWLRGRYRLAMVLGAVAGPLAYQAGSALGAVNIPDQFAANIALAAGWAFILPLLLITSASLEAVYKNRGTANEYI